MLIPGRVEKWLKDKLPSTIDRSQMVRTERPSYPLELVREAVINALIHRDYDIAGAKCHLIVTPHTIVVKSPGAPPPPVTLDQLRTLKAPMLSRNPGLHYVFSQMNLAEERNLGMDTFRAAATKYKLPLPRFRYEDPYLRVTLYRSMDSMLQGLPPEILDALNEDERSGWQALAGEISVSRQDYAGRMSYDARKAQRHLKTFAELGLVERVGSGPSTEYWIVGA